MGHAYRVGTSSRPRGGLSPTPGENGRAGAGNRCEYCSLFQAWLAFTAFHIASVWLLPLADTPPVWLNIQAVGTAPDASLAPLDFAVLNPRAFLGD